MDKPRLNYVVLHVPLKQVKCKQLRRNSTKKKKNKIGSGWKEFCISHSFEEDELICFEAEKNFRVILL